MSAYHDEDQCKCRQENQLTHDSGNYGLWILYNINKSCRLDIERYAEHYKCKNKVEKG